MRSNRYLFVTNPDAFGQRQIVEEDDPRAVCAIVQAGSHMPDHLAEQFGVMQYLAGEEGMERRGLVGAAPVHTDQRQAMHQKGVEMANEVRRHGRSISMHTPGREEKAYVENAVGEAYILSPTERGEAGAMGAEQTGPTLPERAEAGGDVKVAEQKASQAMGGEAAKSEEKPPEAPSAPPKPPADDDPGRVGGRSRPGSHS